jgi:ATP-dependent RNA helicase RhlE
MSFDSLGLSAALLRAVQEQGYTTPTPIQSQVIPVVLAGRDVMAGAQTGTGKTAGFSLPMLQRLAAAATPPSGNRRHVRALVLTPTRELAAQVGESIRGYGRHLPLKSAVVFGGVGIHPQIALLKRGVDVLVATPGRLLDHATQRTVDLSHVEIFVLDEADRMLDMGFLPDIRRVIGLLPPLRQNLLFSATFPDDIRALATRLLQTPATIEVGERNAAAERIEQLVHLVDKGQKRGVLSWLIGSRNWRQVLVFTRTKHGANRLAAQLEQDGLRAAAIHGNKSQAARTRALAEFKSGAVRVLVATDIAARGLDIDQLPHVVNFELPEVPEHYVHRVGRTGRAGHAGLAVSLVAADERRSLKQIERLLGRSLPQSPLDGYEPRAAHAMTRDPAREARQADDRASRPPPPIAGMQARDRRLGPRGGSQNKSHAGHAGHAGHARHKSRAQRRRAAGGHPRG